MPKYLVKASYTASGVQGLLKEGGSGRVQAVTTAIEAAGGTLEGFYFAFGGDDAYVIADMPDNAAAAALSLTVGASGGAECSTVVLLTAEEMDEASRRTVSYRPPGG